MAEAWPKEFAEDANADVVELVADDSLASGAANEAAVESGLTKFESVFADTSAYASAGIAAGRAGGEVNAGRATGGALLGSAVFSSWGDAVVAAGLTRVAIVSSTTTGTLGLSSSCAGGGKQYKAASTAPCNSSAALSAKVKLGGF